MSNTQINTGNYSGYFLEKSISEMVMSFINIRKDKTFSNIFFGITILIGADIIKTIALDLVKEQKQQITKEILEITKHVNILYPIKYSFGLFFDKCNFMVRYFNRVFFSNKQNFLNNMSISQYEMSYKVVESKLFLSNLLNYIENKKNNCTFEKIEDTTLKIEKNKIFNKITYTNIVIPFDDIIIKMNDIILNGTNIDIGNFKNNDIFDEMMDKFIIQLDSPDFLPALSACKICVFFGDSYIGFGIGSHWMTYIDEQYVPVKNDNIAHYPFVIKMFIFSMCCMKYKKILMSSEKLSILAKKVIITAWCITYAITNCVPMKDVEYYNISKLIKNVYNLSMKHIEEIPRDCYVSVKQFNIFKFSNGLCFHDYICRNMMYEILHEKIANKCKNDLMDINECKNNIELKVKLINKSYFCSNTDIITSVKKFITHINGLTIIFDNKNKIKIYSTKIEKKLMSTSTPNQKYLLYLDEKKKLIDNNKNITNEKIIEALGEEPEKELIDVITRRDLSTSHINERYTNFSNLYLADSQDMKLKNILCSFRDDKERFAELGIPNKLCLLLYGKPGTGKTTTIVATASYFNRDIFYVSLKNISNSDLKMIFDYVNEKHLNQGIIVLEDFDTMTNVVSKRTNDTNTNHLLEHKNDDLTLDYFLNILDGTLTYDNSIVIMTTNHLEKIDPAIYRAGRVDLLIEMKNSDHTQIKNIFKKFIQRDIDSSVLNKIEEYKFEPAKIIFRLKEYIKQTDLSDEEIMKPFISLD